MIKNLRDLCDYFSADEPRLLNKRIYKATDCGASISLYLKDGTALHNGSQPLAELSIDTPIRGFTIQTIVEGSDATVDSGEFVLPVKESDVEAFIKLMEEESTRLWEEANNPMCTCGHRSGQHRWAEDPSVKITGAIKGYECTTQGCDCKEFEEDEEHESE